MGIIFLKPDGRQSFQLAGASVRLTAVGITAVGIGLFIAGTKFGIDSVKVPPTGAVNLWRQDLALQEAQVHQAVRASEDSLRALVARLGRLQARTMRLDALGERLVQAAGLERDEFAFDRSPPVGGALASREGLTGRAVSVGDFLSELQALERRLADRRPKLEVLEAVLENRGLTVRTRPSGRPVRHGWRSSGYGYRIDPINGRREFHRGLDFAGRSGSDVVALAAGIVSESDRRPGYGRIVTINHGAGYETRYAHNQKNLVAVGQVVEKGQTIALLGATGRTTGPHVHLEILHNGKPMNPGKLLHQ